MNSNGCTPTSGRRLFALGRLMDFQISRFPYIEIKELFADIMVICHHEKLLQVRHKSRMKKKVVSLKPPIQQHVSVYCLDSDRAFFLASSISLAISSFLQWRAAFKAVPILLTAKTSAPCSMSIFTAQ